MADTTIPHRTSTGSDPWALWHMGERTPPEAILQAPFLALARESQRPPRGDWRNWLLLGGRGAGKTRAGAEWMNFSIHCGGYGRGALVGSSFAEVREVMIDGPSGLRAITPPFGLEPPRYEATRHRLLYSNGAEVHVFSAAQPESLRGPQFEAVWCDELAAWPDGGAAWDMMQLGLRLGSNPRAMATTTPKPSPLIKRLLAEDITAVTRSPTRENESNLAPGFMAVMRAQYGSSHLARQELDGEVLDYIQGAPFPMAQVHESRVAEAPDQFEEIIVAVDPPASIGPKADACGIIAAGRAAPPGFSERCFILADSSVQGAAPPDWAARVCALARHVGATRIIAEANQGGEMVRSVLMSAGASVPVELTHARLDKAGRAAPVSLLYRAGDVVHVGELTALESELAVFGTEGQAGSPDRVDALVWAVWWLMQRPRYSPGIRTL